ncbi:MAG: DUF1015 domain-containing protein [Clostridia bacterium]|nr:DUF1015 domain-containing protein [Clostridia bacterium]
MSLFVPFKAIRPKKEYASLVAALPYDVMNSEEAREKVKGHPYSFIHVDKAEVDLPPETDIYSEEVYLKAAENLKKLTSDGICVKDESPCFYIYRQIMGEVCQTGLVGCAGADDYINNVIKKHEHTRADKEEDRIRHVDTCDANTGPIFLAYRRNNTIDEIIDKYTALTPEYDFVSECEVRNTVWVISDENDTTALTGAFSEISSLYIADGHHRAASAVKVALKRREENPDYKGDEEFNFFLAVAFRAEELKIMDYNRLIKDKSGLSDEELFAKIGEYFDVEEKDSAVKPDRRHSFGLYCNKKWYKLTLKEGLCDENDVLESLDVSVLQKYVISEIFGITDPRTDKRIDFVGGIRGLSELERRCNEDMEIAISMYPTSLSELMAIADSGMVMPPKSTWFEPKLLSGLFIHELK